MISFKEYIYEAWGHSRSRHSYEYELEEIFAKVNTGFEQQRKREENRKAGKYVTEPRNIPQHVLSKYPMSIIVDKLGFEPLMEFERYSTKKMKPNLNNYGAWLWEKIKNNEVKTDDLIDWWLEYDTEITKNQWFDIKYVMKQMDPNKIFDIFKPESNHAFENMINDPGKIFSYTKSNLKLWKLSDDEKAQVLNYYADPVNKDMLVKEIKKLQKNFEKFRPHIARGAEAAIDGFLEKNVYLNDKEYGYNFREHFIKKNEKGSYDGYRSGNNYRDERIDAYYSLVMQTLSDLYGISFSSGAEHYPDGDVKDIKYSYSGNKNNDENIRKFVKEYNNLKLNIKKLGTSKDNGKTSGVYSSSFWTFYREDFEVTVINKETDEEIYRKRHDNVTVGSDYYSGGW